MEPNKQNAKYTKWKRLENWPYMSGNATPNTHTSAEIKLLQYDNQRIFVTVSLGGYQTEATIDTGSVRSFACQKIANMLRTSENSRTNRTNVRMGDGSLVTINETLAINIKMGTCQFELPFLILPVVEDEVLLGMDFLLKAGASFSCGGQTITLLPDKLAPHDLSTCKTNWEGAETAGERNKFLHKKEQKCKAVQDHAKVIIKKEDNEVTTEGRSEPSHSQTAQPGVMASSVYSCAIENATHVSNTYSQTIQKQNLNQEKPHARNKGQGVHNTNVGEKSFTKSKSNEPWKLIMVLPASAPKIKMEEWLPVRAADQRECSNTQLHDSGTTPALQLREAINVRRLSWTPGKRMRFKLTITEKKYKVTIDRRGTEYIFELCGETWKLVKAEPRTMTQQSAT